MDLIGVVQFESILQAKEWVASFLNWYNLEHIHSGINCVTPQERHNLLDKEKLAARRRVYRAARGENPRRWRRGSRKREHQKVVYLDPTMELDWSEKKERHLS